MEIRPVAYYHGPLGSKFGVPRQSGIVEALRGRVVLEPPFAREEALRGLEGFGRIWLLWGFSGNRPDAGELTVRPPRLGGNERVGVFASRSPYRPNPIGLSCVEVERIEGTVIFVKGADLMDGTPVYDIKPYVPYADAFPDAAPGFAPAAPEPVLTVTEGPGWVNPFDESDFRTLKDLLALDPRPAFHDDPGRVYGLPFGGYDVKFRVNGTVLVLLAAEK